MNFTMNTIRKIVYGGILTVISLGFVACSNLEDSAFVPTPVEESIIFSHTFIDDIGGFTSKSIKGDQVWTYNSRGYIGISGYINATKENVANEDWLISPEINLMNVETAFLSFEYVLFKGNVATDGTIWISDNYNANDSIKSENWTQLKFDATPDNGNYEFIQSPQISLNDFAGKKVRIAIRYLSTASSAGTFEMRNFTVKRGTASNSTSSIYSEPFSSSLGLFKPYSISGDEKWYFTNGYAYMTGFVNSTNKANIDWLISPEIDLSGFTTANFSFDHVTRYFANTITEATVWISDNYIDGTRPDSVIWTQVATSPFVNPGTWTFSNSQKLSLTSWCGKKVHLAFKYISTASKAGSWEIKNFKVLSGEANGTDILPYTVKEAVSSQTGGLAWVEGYVVGYSWPLYSQFKFYFSADTCSQITNVLLADTTANLYTSRCISVQLPRGNIRNGINIKTNKNLFGQKVKIYGTLSSNSGIAGVLNPQKYILADGKTGDGSAYLYESFSTSLGDFTTYNVLGAPVWSWSSQYSCAIINGYMNGTRYINDDWLISPVINIPASATEVAVNFSMAAKYFSGTLEQNCSLYITTNYTSGDPTAVNWEKLTIPKYDLTDKFIFTNTTDIDISKYIGNSNIRIAIRYTSNGTTTGTGQLEIKNFQVY